MSENGDSFTNNRIPPEPAGWVARFLDPTLNQDFPDPPIAFLRDFPAIHLAQEGLLKSFDSIDSNSNGRLSQEELRNKNHRFDSSSTSYSDKKTLRIPTLYGFQRHDKLKAVSNDDWGREGDISEEDLKAHFFSIKTNEVSSIANAIFEPQSNTPDQKLALIEKHQGTLNSCFLEMDTDKDGYISKDEIRDFSLKQNSPEDFALFSRIHSDYDQIAKCSNDELLSETKMTRDDLDQYFVHKKAAIITDYAHNHADAIFEPQPNTLEQKLALIEKHEESLNRCLLKIDADKDGYVSKDELRNFSLKQISHEDFALLSRIYADYDQIAQCSNDQFLNETQITRDDLDQYFWQKKVPIITDYAHDHFSKWANSDGFVTEQKLAQYKNNAPATEIPIINLLQKHLYDIARGSDDEEYFEWTGFTRNDLDKYSVSGYRSGYRYINRS